MWRGRSQSSVWERIGRGRGEGNEQVRKRPEIKEVEIVKLSEEVKRKVLEVEKEGDGDVLEEFEKRYVEEGIEEDIFLEDGGFELKESGELIKFNEPIL